MEDSVLLGKEGERRPISLDKHSKMRTGLILPQINRLGEMMPITEWNTICSHHCYLLTYSVCTDYVRMRRHILPTWGEASRQDSGLDWTNSSHSHMKETWHNHTLLSFILLSALRLDWSLHPCQCFVFPMKPKMYSVLTVRSMLCLITTVPDRCGLTLKPCNPDCVA